jgi:AP2 domain/HNH endonuclease
MSVREYPSADFVRQCFAYNDGLLFWKERPIEHFKDERAWKIWNSRFSGKEAGCLGTGGRGKKLQVHWIVCVNKRFHLRHTIVYAIHHGLWVIGIDHEDRNPLNDRIENLRPATQSQNNANKSIMSNNKCGFKGVFWEPRRYVWVARIGVNGKLIHLGQFDYAVDAHKAYCEAARKYYGEFACDG